MEMPAILLRSLVIFGASELYSSVQPPAAILLKLSPDPKVKLPLFLFIQPVLPVTQPSTAFPSAGHSEKVAGRLRPTQQLHLFLSISRSSGPLLWASHCLLAPFHKFPTSHTTQVCSEQCLLLTELAILQVYLRKELQPSFA